MYCTKCGSQLNENEVCANCSTTTTGSNLVKVIISRRSAFTGAIVNYAVFIDGKEVGKLGNGKSLEVMLSPGSHNFAFNMWSASDSENVTIPENCSEYYVDTMIEMGALTNKILIVWSSPQKYDPNSASAQNGMNATPGKMTTNAIISLVCGIIGIFFAALPMGVVSLCLGITALKHIRVFPQDKGKVLAIIGVVLGTLDTLAGFLIFL